MGSIALRAVSTSRRWRSVCVLASRGLVWADCEALERRHNLGRGTLVVLDSIPESTTPTHEQTRPMLGRFVKDAGRVGD